jgi:uncharacterized membrane protein YczE
MAIVQICNFSRRALIYIGGLTLSSIGLALALQSQMGVSTWDTVYAALSLHTPITIGAWSIIIQFVFWSITSILNRKAEILCIVPIVIRGITLDISKSLVSTFLIENTIINQIILFFIGYILVGIGIGAYVSTGFSRLPIDGLMMALSKSLSWTINKSRFLIEILGFICALILRGTFGAGTVIVTFTIAPFISCTKKIIQEYLKTGVKNK